MSELTIERVQAAYTALGTLDYAKAAEYWHEDVRWNSPGNHQYAGWHEGLETFLAFLAKVGEVSAGTWASTSMLTFVDPSNRYSADVSRTVARRAGAAGPQTPYDALAIEGVHLLKWLDGRVIEGRGAMFEDGLTNFNLWWSPVTSTHHRVAQ
jgi:hypothetical protein